MGHYLYTLTKLLVTLPYYSVTFDIIVAFFSYCVILKHENIKQTKTHKEDMILKSPFQSFLVPLSLFSLPPLLSRLLFLSFPFVT